MRHDMKRELIEEFKARLKRMEVAVGLNDRSLSLKATLGPTAVRDILQGKSSEPRYSTIRCLSGALGCQMTDLVPDDPSWPALPPVANLAAPDSGEPCVAETIIVRAVTACDEAAQGLQIDLTPERRADYTLRICRWAAAERKRTGEHLTLEKMRELIAFAIQSNS